MITNHNPNQHKLESLAEQRNDILLSDISSWPKKSATAVTITFAKKFSVNGQRAEEAARAFLNKINTACFGSAFKRHGKQCRVIAGKGLDKQGRWHYHLTIERPKDRFSRDDFESILKDQWSFIRDQDDIKVKFRHTDKKTGKTHDIDAGWIRYSIERYRGHKLDLNLHHNPKS